MGPIVPRSGGIRCLRRFTTDVHPLLSEAHMPPQGTSRNLTETMQSTGYIIIPNVMPLSYNTVIRRGPITGAHAATRTPGSHL